VTCITVLHTVFLCNRSVVFKSVTFHTMKNKRLLQIVRIDNLKFTYVTVGLVIGVIGTWLVTAKVFTPGSYSSSFDGMKNIRQPMVSETIDAHFIEQMIPHHEDAITMAKIALTKTQRPEVKKLAMSIIDTQNHEIEQMKKWYTSWFDREIPTGDNVMSQHGMMGNNGMHMGVRGDETDIAALEQATEFDMTFVEHMIPHHQMAVMMASMLKNSTTRPEMKQLADEIITAQTNEIDQMREWLKEWNK
jgi:uncharacterized protein (DUF305 family)